MKHHNIVSENSEHHWPYLNTLNKNLLDLGCGRHDTHDLSQSSPIYLGEKGAKKVIAVDANGGEIEYFNQNNPDPRKYTFICKTINTPDDIKSLIREYNIEVLKIDIEGYETNLYDFTKEDFVNINDLGIEYHSYEILNNITKKIEEWGFNIDVEGKFAFVEAPQMGVLFCSKK
jgi:hypothetical protein